jgi:hypothetical protein
MMSQHRWTILVSRIVGRSSGGTESKPCTTVALPVLGSESHDASRDREAAGDRAVALR